MGAEVPGTLHGLVERVIDESGLRAHYVKQAKTSKSETDEERIDNLDELISSARQFEDEYDPANDPVAFPGADEAEAGAEAQIPPLLALLRAYLESIALVADADAVDPRAGRRDADDPARGEGARVPRRRDDRARGGHAAPRPRV